MPCGLSRGRGGRRERESAAVGAALEGDKRRRQDRLWASRKDFSSQLRGRSCEAGTHHDQTWKRDRDTAPWTGKEPPLQDPVSAVVNHPRLRVEPIVLD